MSSTDSVLFADEIRRTAAALGRSPTDEQVANLEMLARSRTYIDAAAGRVMMNDGGDVAAFLTRETNAFPLVQAEPAASEGWVKLQNSASTWYRKANDPLTKIVTGFQAAEDAALAREIAGWPNPWRAGHQNRTRQAVITNKDPARAAQLKAQAAA